MKKILLVCSAGMSTSLLVSKMKKSAKEKEIDVDIKSTSEYEINRYIDEADIVLIAPQIRFLENKVRKLVESKEIKVETVDSVAYGRMQGDQILIQALSLINS